MKSRIEIRASRIQFPRACLDERMPRRRGDTEKGNRNIVKVNGAEHDEQSI